MYCRLLHWSFHGHVEFYCHLYLLTYLLTYLLSYLLTYFLTYLPYKFVASKTHLDIVRMNAAGATSPNFT